MSSHTCCTLFIHARTWYVATEQLLRQEQESELQKLDAVNDNASSTENTKENAGQKNPKVTNKTAKSSSAHRSKRDSRPDDVHDATRSTKVVRRTSPRKQVITLHLLCSTHSQHDASSA
jgi:hypothetical protein